MNCQIKHKMKWLISDVCIVCESDIIHRKQENIFSNPILSLVSEVSMNIHAMSRFCAAFSTGLPSTFSSRWHGLVAVMRLLSHGSSSNATNQEGLTKKEGDDVCAAAIM